VSPPFFVLTMSYMFYMAPMYSVGIMSIMYHMGRGVPSRMPTADRVDLRLNANMVVLKKNN